MNRRFFLSFVSLIGMLCLDAATYAQTSLVPAVPTSARGTFKSKVRRGYKLTTNDFVRLIDSVYLTVDPDTGTAVLTPTVSGAHSIYIAINQTWDLKTNNPNPSEDPDLEFMDDGLVPPIPIPDYELCSISAQADVNAAGELAESIVEMKLPVEKKIKASANYPGTSSDSKSDGYFKILTSSKPLFVRFRGSINLQVVKS